MWAHVFRLLTNYFHCIRSAHDRLICASNHNQKIMRSAKHFGYQSARICNKNAVAAPPSLPLSLFPSLIVSVIYLCSTPFLPHAFLLIKLAEYAEIIKWANILLQLHKHPLNSCCIKEEAKAQLYRKWSVYSTTYVCQHYRVFARLRTHCICCNQLAALATRIVHCVCEAHN